MANSCVEYMDATLHHAAHGGSKRIVDHGLDVHLELLGDCVLAFIIHLLQLRGEIRISSQQAWLLP